MEDFVEWRCQFCDKIFATKTKMEDHQVKTKGSKKIGCKVKYDKRMRSANRASSSTTGSLSSSVLTFPLEDCPPSDDLLDEIIAAELDDAEVAAGRASVPPVRDNLKQMLHERKVAMSRSLSGKIIHGPSVNRVVLPTVSRLYGEVTKVVEDVLAHSDFDSTSDRSKVVEIRCRRNDVFEQIAVNVNQDNAVIKHRCNPSECSSDCTFGRRRTLFHIQQTLYSLEVASSRKGLTDSWITRAADHMRRVLVENRSTYSEVLALVLNQFGSELGQKLEVLKFETASLGIDPTPAAAPAPARRKVPVKEVSQTELDKGQNR